MRRRSLTDHGCIVVSARTIPGMKHDFLEPARLLGVAAALRKPVTADQLVDTVRRALPA